MISLCCVLYLRAYFVSSYSYRCFYFLQGRSFNPYFNRHILCYLIMIFVHITSNRGRLAAFSKRAHEPFYRIVCYVATLSLSVTSRAASLQCIRNFSRITTEINIVNTVQENFGCCVVILGSIGLNGNRNVRTIRQPSEVVN